MILRVEFRSLRPVRRRAARIKEELLKDFNLHTIVRLPQGVFEPYTPIASNLLFFDRSGPTQDVWYYELPVPEGRKNYTKTRPLQHEEFAPCLAWWHDRAENEHAWRVPAATILANGCNLDSKNPHAATDLEHWRGCRGEQSVSAGTAQCYRSPCSPACPCTIG